MYPLARELRDLGYERTERESPFHDDGTLWTNSYELVCDRTGAVIRKNSSGDRTETSDEREAIHRYRNSDEVKLYGGYVSSHDWGSDGDGNFTYNR